MPEAENRSWFVPRGAPRLEGTRGTACGARKKYPGRGGLDRGAMLAPNGARGTVGSAMKTKAQKAQKAQNGQAAVIGFLPEALAITALLLMLAVFWP